MQFSEFKENDLSAIGLIENEVHAFPWTQGNFLDSIKSNHTCLMMKLNEEIIGYTVMMFVLDECHLLNISIKKNMQKKAMDHIYLMKLFIEQIWLAQKRFILK